MVVGGMGDTRIGSLGCNQVVRCQILPNSRYPRRLTSLRPTDAHVPDTKGLSCSFDFKSYPFDDQIKGGSHPILLILSSSVAVWLTRARLTGQEGVWDTPS